MSFLNVLEDCKKLDYNKKYSQESIISAIYSDEKTKERLLILLSESAELFLEKMAIEAKRITLKNFGYTIQLFTPLYLSDYCINDCIYCGYSAKNKFSRKTLTFAEVEKEAKYISTKGLKHILILSGESRKMCSFDYIKKCVRILKKYFDSISIEIYPLEDFEYKELVNLGLDGIIFYQEVYDKEIYKKVHVTGPKKDFELRMENHEIICRSKIRTVGIGSLLGLNDFRREVLSTALHGKYLEDKYPDIEFGISVPRIKNHFGDYKSEFELSDKNFVQAILAYRLFLPRFGITLSTREEPYLRENLIGLGITKMSADSSTVVGGHTTDREIGQFELSDKRSVLEIKKLLLEKGYQPVFKDWVG